MSDPRFYTVQNPTFMPAMANILSITNANPALVTTTIDGINPGAHNYLSGLIVRLLIPPYYGMQQLYQTNLPGSADPDDTGTITVTSTTTFTIDIDTSTMDPFVIPAAPTGPLWQGKFNTPAQVLPVGEINDNLNQATQNILPYP